MEPNGAASTSSCRNVPRRFEKAAPACRRTGAKAAAPSQMMTVSPTRGQRSRLAPDTIAAAMELGGRS